MVRSKLWSSLGLAVAMLSAPAWADSNFADQPGPAMPGTVNYVEGQAKINGQPVDRNAIGSLGLQPGQTLTTQNGKAEMLLTPGVFVRLGSNSSIQMVSPDLANIEIRIDRGRALVEVDSIQKENRIQVDAGNVPVLLQEKGLYDFDADKSTVRVFDGRAAVLQGNHETRVSGGHQIDPAIAKLKTQGFDKKAYEDDLYRWSQLRSSYLGEANVEMARTYNTGYGWAPEPWIGSSWYWDPWYSAYTWLPDDGLFWSPFGFGFYSPIFVGRAPFFAGGFHRNRTFGAGYHPTPGFNRGAVRANGFAGSRAGAGFNGGGRAFSGGGFSRGGMAGGFSRGGMSGGGFHGGGGSHGGGGRR